MKKRLPLFILAVLCGLNSPVRADDALADWANSFVKPEVQQKILSAIFPDQVGSVADATLDKQNGTYFFKYDSSWVRLGKDFVWNPGTEGAPFLVVTAMLTHAVDQEPVNATSYLFRDTTGHPSTLTAGYATHERLHLIKLPKLDKSFIVVEDSVASPQGAMRQWSAFLLAVDASGLSDHPQNVWSSPMTTHSFQLGFTDLDGKSEDLVLRTVPPGVPKNTSSSDYSGTGSAYPNSGSSEDDTSASQYVAYRWTGDHFEVDSLVFDSRIQALPKTVWQYGTNR